MSGFDENSTAIDENRRDPVELGVTRRGSVEIIGNRRESAAIGGNRQNSAGIDRNRHYPTITLKEYETDNRYLHKNSFGPEPNRTSNQTVHMDALVARHTKPYIQIKISKIIKNLK